jgi:predicted amidohydrolase
MLRIALLQMVARGNDQAANLAKGEDFCRRARATGADLALFPEMWNIGCMPYPGCARNAVALIDRRGEIVLTYAKVHTCDFGLDAACTPGEDFPVCSLETEHGPVAVGAMICYDREFPEAARILMLRGAEIIVVPNGCDLEANRLGQFRARAFENMVGVAMANYAAPQANGHSVAFDGMAFDAHGNSRDTLLVEAGEQEGVYLAAFDVAALRAYRARETWGNAFRRPHRYGSLTSPGVSPPFKRTDARGEAYDPGGR